MGVVIVDLSVSLYGFIAGANDGPDNLLGDGGEGLFAWMNASRRTGSIRTWPRPTRARSSSRSG